MTLAEARRYARAQLAAAGIDEAALEADLLLAACLEVERAFLPAHGEVLLTPEQEQRYRDWVERRARREPLAYITGRRWFYGLELVVTPAVLIPRPETELLVELALAWLERRRMTATVVDVGTGSGAVAVALACHTPPTVPIVATDISAAALAVAQTNAQRHGVADRIAWFQGDLLAPLTMPVDLILANLPYVALAERDRLMPEVRDFEPPEALFAGEDGLSLIGRLLAQAPAHLRPGGGLLLEIGYGQAEAVLALAQASFPAAHLALHPDLAGIPRVLQVET